MGVPTKKPKVYILVLNWNGWKDTIECLESVMRSDYTTYQVIVCDNGSTDNSLENIQSWANGEVFAQTKNVLLEALTIPPVVKPVSYIKYDRATAEHGGGGEPCSLSVPLILIDNGANLGFAGGNNVGLRYAMAKKDFEYIWILNNDTVVDVTALSALVEKCESDPKIGLCGSTLRFYDHPEILQALGGARYNKWFGLVSEMRNVGLGDFSDVDERAVEKQISYVSGASMIVTQTFIERIGLMNEVYFLYYEEIDWATRARKSFTLGYAKASIVYHKEGASIGTDTLSPQKKSSTADYYGVLSRLKYTRIFFPYLLPSVYLGILVTLLVRLRRRQWARAKRLASLLFRPIRIDGGIK